MVSIIIFWFVVCLYVKTLMVYFFFLRVEKMQKHLVILLSRLQWHVKVTNKRSILKNYYRIILNHLYKAKLNGVLPSCKYITSSLRNYCTIISNHLYKSKLHGVIHIHDWLNLIFWKLNCSLIFLPMTIIY